MIRGQEQDLRKRRYGSVGEVLEYAYLVASTVGLMLLPILAPGKEERLKQSAVHLGYAMQITNILRDIGEDLERNRIYLPKDMMDDHHISEEILANKEVTKDFKAIWEDLAERAELFYQSGLKDMSVYPVYSRIPVRAAAYFYKEILNSVRANDYEVFHQRAIVTSENKQQIMKEMVDV